MEHRKPEGFQIGGSFRSPVWSQVTMAENETGWKESDCWGVLLEGNVL